MSGFVIKIIYEYKPAFWRLGPDKKLLRRILCEMLTCAASRGYMISAVDLSLVDDAAIADLNKRFLGCTGPTNIISFPATPPMPGLLALSVDTCDRECLFFGQNPDEYLIVLLAHGIGHLAGLDHGEEMDNLAHACEAGAMKYWREYK